MLAATKRLTLDVQIFEVCRRITLRHWPAGALWVDLPHPFGTARLYRDGSVDLLS